MHDIGQPTFALLSLILHKTSSAQRRHALDVEAGVGADELGFDALVGFALVGLVGAARRVDVADGGELDDGGADGGACCGDVFGLEFFAENEG